MACCADLYGQDCCEKRPGPRVRESLIIFSHFRTSNASSRRQLRGRHIVVNRARLIPCLLGAYSMHHFGAGATPRHTRRDEVRSTCHLTSMAPCCVASDFAITPRGTGLKVRISAGKGGAWTTSAVCRIRHVLARSLTTGILVTLLVTRACQDLHRDRTNEHLGMIQDC